MRILMFATLLLTACGWDNGAQLQKPTPDYPCGAGYHMCPNRMCCGLGWICGGDPGCPAGSCCFVGARKLHDAGYSED